MKKPSKTLLIAAALLVVPFASVQARETSAQHEAWIKAQKIDIKPTITVTETQIPAGSEGGASSQGSTAPASGSYMPSNNSTPSSNMPSSNMPSSNMPSSGTYTPQGTTPIYTQPSAK